MRFNPGVFKAYDIRGKYPAEIDDDFAYALGAALVKFFRRKSKVENPKLIVCRDLRSSSASLRNSLVKGILSEGGSVLDVRVGTTPFFTFAVNTARPNQGGVMVTASHNPPEYNGFKIRDGKGEMVFSQNGLREIRRIIKAGPKKAANMGGVVEESAEYHEKYAADLARRVKIGKISAVVDAGGGATALFLPQIFTKFPELVYKPLFFEPDGSFKNHSPNPLLPEAQKFVKHELAAGAYRLGILFDGDGDRVLFFDERGNQIKSEFILALLAEETLKQHPGSAFVMPVNTSRGAREYIAEKGGKVKISKVGYVFVQRLMKRVKAPLGVEISGHFHFEEFFRSDAGILTALLVLQKLSRTPASLSRLTRPLEKYISSGEVNFTVSGKGELLNAIKRRYKTASPVKFGKFNAAGRKKPKARISALDGITVEYPEWWFNLRPSNTEPLVRLVLEAGTKEFFEEKYKEVEELIKKY